MVETRFPLWRGSLNIVVDSISAEYFCEELVWLREEYGNDPHEVGVAYVATLTEWFVGSASLFAALHLPLDEVPAALAEIHQTLAHLDFDAQRKRLKRQERHYYDCFATLAAPLFAEMGAAMEALFNCYVAGDYDPEANPDDLIAEALERAGEDLEHARHLIVQAGAIALHSRPLWWRWPAEAEGPARSWLITLANLVNSYTVGGQAVLGPLAQARAEAEDSLRELTEEIEETKEGEEEEAEPPAPARSPVDDLTAELIEQGEKGFTPEQLALCQARRDEAVPVLLDLATDERLHMEDSPGDGYAPISAVQLLGELKAVEAVPDLIDVVADSDPQAIIFSAAIHALQQIGPPALEPVLAFMRYSWDVETKTALAEVVGELGQRDERTYQTLVTVWEETTWADGKSLLAYPLAHTGGKQAIPLLEAALEDAELDDRLDYNEIADALQELGVETPPPPEGLERVDGDLDVGDFARLTLLRISDPQYLEGFADLIPEEAHSNPDGLAHLYTAVARDKMNNLLALQVITMPEVSAFLTTDLLEATETLKFDAATRDEPRWLRQAYAHLAECAGPEFQYHLAGVLLSLHHYLNEAYHIADDPDQLLAAARELPANDEEQRRLFGQAGALVLHGRPCWSLWPDEMDCPLSDWLSGLTRFRDLLGQIGQIPLQPSSAIEPAEIVAALTESLKERTAQEAPPAVAELLNTLIAQQQGTLSPAQRRQFAHQRATLVPYLLRIAEDQQYWDEDGPGGGWAAILAVRMLGEFKAVQAADTLVRVVADSEPADVLHDSALFSLMAIGHSAFPAVQAYFRYGRRSEAKTSLAEVLGRISHRNPHAFTLLQPVWEATGWSQNRRTVALAFGDLRDRRAIPLLQAALEDRAADGLDLDYVHWALRHLGIQAPAPSARKESRLNAPAPDNPRLFYDEHGDPQRVKYTVWAEPLCPDCGQPLVQDASGAWTHSPGQPPHRPAPGESRHRRRERKHGT